MKKLDILKLALMGLAIGGAMNSCSNNSANGTDETTPSSEKSGCKGKNGCTGKSDCTGRSGCKGDNGCTGKSDCTGRSNCKSNKSNMQSDASESLKAKRKAAAEGIVQ